MVLDYAHIGHQTILPKSRSGRTDRQRISRSCYISILSRVIPTFLCPLFDIWSTSDKCSYHYCDERETDNQIREEAEGKYEDSEDYTDKEQCDALGDIILLLFGIFRSIRSRQRYSPKLKEWYCLIKTCRSSRWSEYRQPFNSLWKAYYNAFILW